MLTTDQINIETTGNCHMVDLTHLVQQRVDGAKVKDGVIILFVVGSTAGLTTIEYEPGLVNHDIAAACETFAPADGHYEHEATWHDDNGHSHVRASLVGPSLNVPLVNGELTLGTWQQIVIIDFDTRPRQRTVVCQIIGE